MIEFRLKSGRVVNDWGDVNESIDSIIIDGFCRLCFFDKYLYRKKVVICEEEGNRKILMDMGAEIFCWRGFFCLYVDINFYTKKMFIRVCDVELLRGIDLFSIREGVV